LPRFVAGRLGLRLGRVDRHPPRPIKRSMDDSLRAITLVLGGVCIVARCPFLCWEEQERRVVR
jgi:hypothetical protein